jgi:ABC-type transport system involved in cytochrome c biogenesis permease subunit
MTGVSTTMALLLITAGIVVRWRAIGHPPVFGSYENSLACSWFLLVTTLVLTVVGKRAPYWRCSALVTLPSVVAVVLWGTRFSMNRIDLTISERSIWIDLHAGVAWVAYAAATVALFVAVLAVAHGVVARLERGMAIGLPPRQWTDEMLVQSTSWAFLGVTAIIATGAWYSWLLFGEAWRWDVVEVLALVNWLAFGLALHLRLFYGWRGTRLATVVLFGYVVLLAMFWILALFPVSSYHFFELPF